MATFSVSELESAIEKWNTSTGVATKGPWNRHDGFWLVSEPRRVHFRFCFDGSVEIELFQGPACKLAPVSAVHQAVQLIDLFLRQGCGFEAFPGGDWKSFWRDSPVPAYVIEHPERITVDEIDNQPDRRLRSAMIEQYGVERYWHDTKLKPTGFIHELRHVANVIDNWRASTRTEVEVVREVLCEDDPRNTEEVIIIRSGSRQVVFGEPSVWRDSRVFVSISEGTATKMASVSRREEAERLLDIFLRQRCHLKSCLITDGRSRSGEFSGRDTERTCA